MLKNTQINILKIHLNEANSATVFLKLTFLNSNWKLEASIVFSVYLLVKLLKKRGVYYNAGILFFWKVLFFNEATHHNTNTYDRSVLNSIEIEYFIFKYSFVKC